MSRTSWRHVPLPLLVASLLALGCGDASEEPVGPGSQGELTGLTVLENEVPLPGVGLLVRRGDTMLATTSDDEGGFGFDALAAGNWSLVVSPPQGYALRSGEPNPRQIEIKGAELVQTTINLVNGVGSGSIIAQVLADSVTPDGHQFLPVAGVLVSATGPGDFEIIRFARSGDNGLAVISAPPGEYVVEIELPQGWTMAEGSERRLTGVMVTEGGSTELEFRIVADGSPPSDLGRIAGTALLNDLEPVAGLRAELTRDDFIQVDETGANGTFEFANLSQGPWSLEVFPPEGLVLAPDEPNPQIVVIEPGNLYHPVNISLTFPEGTGALVAQATADSAFLAGVTMRVYEQDASVALESRLTNDNGRVTFTLLPGSYDLEIVVPEGYALPPGEPARQRGFGVTAGHSAFAWFELVPSGS